MDPKRDPQLALPDDPTGIIEAHDVLAAEEYAMPAGPDRLAHVLRNGDLRGPLALVAAAAVVALLYLAIRRR
jgi:hypothetical protein